MAAPQAIVSFPGVRFVESADVSFSALGVSPSVFSIRMTPQDENIAYLGTLRLTFGGQTVCQFPDCLVDSASAEYSQTGRIVSIQIMDRRWRWVDCGHISGQYNTRGADGEIKHNEKPPRELAQLCLEAMGESGFDTYDLPNDARPEIDWDYDNPARALNDLVSGLGCCVVLQLNNRVAIRKIGKGAGGRTVRLPNGPVTPNYSTGIDPDDEPDSHTVVGARVRWQVDLELEAVALEADGSLSLVDEAEYAPENTWALGDLEWFSVVEGDDNRKLAKQSVYRWYRIKTPFKVPGLTLDGEPNAQIDDLTLVTPIEAEQVEQENIDDVTQNKPAVVFGEWYRLGGAVADSNEDDFAPLNEVNLCDVSWSLDADRGIVKFTEQVFALFNGDLLPARLCLRTAISVRDSETRAWIRYERTKNKTSGQFLGTETKVLRHEELALWFVPEYSEEGYPNGDATTEDNRELMDREADKLIEYERAQYQVHDPEHATYAGWYTPTLDGSIQAVSYSCGSAGGFMTLSRNQDRGGPATLSFEQRQMLAKNRLARDNIAKLLGVKNPAEQAKAIGSAPYKPGGGQL